MHKQVAEYFAAVVPLRAAAAVERHIMAALQASGYVPVSLAVTDVKEYGRAGLTVLTPLCPPSCPVRRDV